MKMARTLALILFFSVSFSSSSAFGSGPVKFDSGKAWGLLTKQVDFGPRVPGTPAHINCRDFLRSELEKSCDHVRLQEFSHRWSSSGQGVTMWNIVGEQNWKDAKVRVALFAHWDSRPTADQETDESLKKQPIPGANDGASGVAVLLELARSIKDSHPGVGIMYVLTDGEDLGPGLNEMFLGATAFARIMSKPKPTYGILLDMIGDKDLRVPMEPNSQYYAPDLTRALYRHAATVGLKDTFPAVMGPEIEDDHLAINQAGVPTIDLIDFTYAPWHTLSDTTDKCSAESLGKVGKLLETWLTKVPIWVPPYRG